MVVFEEITVILSDGYRAYGRYWSPPSPRGAVLYHHGIQSHCGWYESSARMLVEAGFAVLQVDRRGSGLNQVDRGHAESAEQLIEDACLCRDELLHRLGLDEYHVVGVSWGGKLAVAAYVVHPEGVRSLTLVTPGLFPQVGVSRGQMAKIGFSMLYERHKLFDIPLDDADMFTGDPKWQSFIETDPPTLRRCTAGFYLASRRMDKIIARLGTCVPVPIHLCLAGRERIIDNDKTREFIGGLEWSSTRVTTYETARHSLEFENDPQVYFGDLVSFVGGVSS